MNQKDIFSKIIASLLQPLLCLVASFFASSSVFADALIPDDSFHPPGFAKATPAERMNLALSNILYKRLTYAELTGKDGETPF